jgi:hypothetical protein
MARLTSRTPLAPVRKQVLDPLRQLRRQGERSLHRVHERTARSGRLAANRLRRARHVARSQVRNVPQGWKRVRRAIRQARYTLGMMRRGQSAARPGKS